MATLLPAPKAQFFDADGNPLSDGLLYSYAAGTSTPQALYSDPTGSIAHENPLELDAAGREEIWMGTGLSYKLELRTTDDVLVWTVDHVREAGELSLSLRTFASVPFAALPAAGTAGRVYLVTDTIRGLWLDNGTQWRPVTPVANVRDFGALGNGVDDDALALQTADAAALAAGAALFIPPGTYRLAQNLTLSSLIAAASLGVLRPNAGVTVTLPQAPQVGRWRIFDADGTGTGTIVFTNKVTVFPEWWGAKHNVDSTVAWKSMLAALNQPGLAGLQSTILADAATYLISEPLVWPLGSGTELHRISVQGMHAGNLTSSLTSGATRLHYTGTTGACIDLRLGTNSTTVNYQGMFSNLGITGTKAAGTYGITAWNMLGAGLEHVHIQSFDRGLNIANDYYFSAFDWVTVQTCLGHGIFGGGLANGATLEHVRASLNGGDGIHLELCGVDLVIKNSWTGENSGYGIWVSDHRSCTLQNVYTEGDALGPVFIRGRQVGGNASVNTIIGCSFTTEGSASPGCLTCDTSDMGYYVAIGNTADGPALFYRSTSSTNNGHITAVSNGASDWTPIPQLVDTSGASQNWNSITCIGDVLARQQFGSLNYSEHRGVAGEEGEGNVPTHVQVIVMPSTATDGLGGLRIDGRKDGQTAPHLLLNYRVAASIAHPFLRCQSGDGADPRFQVNGDGRILHGPNLSKGILSVGGNPEGAVSGEPGWIAQSDNGNVYRKTGTGNTGWIAM